MLDAGGGVSDPPPVPLIGIAPAPAVPAALPAFTLGTAGCVLPADPTIAAGAPLTGAPVVIAVDPAFDSA